MDTFSNPKEFQSHRVITEALVALNNKLVELVDELSVLNSHFKSCMASLAESGVPVEFCKAFEEQYYILDKAYMRDLTKNITTLDLPWLKKQYDVELRLVQHYSGMGGGSLSVGTYKTPQAYTGNTTPKLGSHKGGPQDYEVQLNAICDFMDILVDHRDKLVLQRDMYIDLCKGLVESGVEKHIAQHYEVNCAQPNLRRLYQIINHIQDDDYNFFNERYMIAVEGMVGIGNFFIKQRSPRKM